MIHTGRYALRISNTGKPGQTSSWYRPPTPPPLPVVSASRKFVNYGLSQGGSGEEACNNNGEIMGGWIRDDRKFDVLEMGEGFLARKCFFSRRVKIVATRECLTRVSFRETEGEEKVRSRYARSRIGSRSKFEAEWKLDGSCNW